MLGNSYSLSPLFKKSEKRDELKQFSHPRATCLQFLRARQLMQVNLVDNVTVDAVLWVNMKRGLPSQEILHVLTPESAISRFTCEDGDRGSLAGVFYFLTEETMKYLPAG